MPSSCRALLVLLIAAAACSTASHSREEQREFGKLEQALSVLSLAPEEDRGIRLQEIMRFEFRDPAVKELRDLCAESYQSFGRAAMMLDQAKTETKEVEKAIAKAEEEHGGKSALSLDEENELRKRSEAAQKSLNGVTASLDRAEELVKECDLRRQKMRERLANR